MKCDNRQNGEAGVDWVNGLIIHHGDDNWHQWDAEVYEADKEDK